MRSRKITILVVDDDPAVLQTEVSALAELGYDVIRSDSAAEALELIAGTDAIDLLRTDLVCPATSVGRPWPIVLAVYYRS